MITIPTKPIPGQRPGTSGLRKKTREFMQPHYLENFVQALFDALKEDADTNFREETLIVGGDGRFYNRQAMQTIIRMSVANGLGRVLVGRGGILSTPAMSAAIRRRAALGGIILSASHNLGGIEADFGVKYNIRNGGPAPGAVTELIYRRTLDIARYFSLDTPDVDIDRDGTTMLEGTRVDVIDPLEDYTAVMQGLFDFDALRALFKGGFRILFDAMHAVTGPYARHIFVDLLGAPEDCVMNGTPMEDFGGLHPDPNLVHAAALVSRMAEPSAPDFGAACDGDGDRNLILGRGFFVTPGDSLAMIAENARTCIPGYRAGLAGVARSMPTSTAVDRVARALGIPCHETPTGWKFFGSLMDAGMCTICGEESFGTGSNHVREKDGLWAVLSWISIVGSLGKPVRRIAEEHWSRFGRSYYQRHDFEALDAEVASGMISSVRAKLPTVRGTRVAGAAVTLADDFRYTDPVDGSVSEHQGIRLLLEDGSRIVGRLSGTGTQGATLRVYLERYLADGTAPPEEILQPMRDAAYNLFGIHETFHRDRADVIT